MLFFPGRTRVCREWLGRIAWTPNGEGAEQSGTEHTHVGEFVLMRNSEVERLPAAHGEPSDSAMLPVVESTVVFLYIRQNAAEQILFELVCGRTRAGGGGGPPTPKARVCPAGMITIIGFALPCS